jgi:hypothetical protein
MMTKILFYQNRLIAHIFILWQRKTWIAVFQPEFRKDLRFWAMANPKTALRAFDIIENVMREPF